VEHNRAGSDLGLSARDAFSLLETGSDWVRLSRMAEPWAGTSPRTVTYSRNIAIPVTQICRNRCAYCSFAEAPGRTGLPLLSPKESESLLRRGAASRCREALFLTGERPEQASPEVRKRLASWGYRDMVAYLVHMGDIALRYGLLPHTNAGVLDPDELKALRDVNASMGLMLESSSERLCKDPGPHAHSPGKRPDVRLRVIEEAGKLNIPFTTGILVGIGEDPRERIDALLRIRDLHLKYGHIQEVIIQPFCPRPGTPMSSVAAPPVEDVLAAVAYARLILGPHINIQTPPNLVLSHELTLRAGANDWGGVSPLTRDPINPFHPWPALPVLQRSAQRTGAVLKERLPVYPEFMTDRHLSPRVRNVAAALVDREGYVKENHADEQHPQEHR